jgi:NADPH:quinone reductase
MRAAVVHTVGEAPRPADVPEPEPGEGEALVGVEAVPLNPVEVRVAAGSMRPPQVPYVPGLEGVGVVVRSGRLEAGTRVRFESHLPGFGKDGVMSEIATVDDETLVPLPSEVETSVAAAAGVVGVTALLALRRAGLEPGERVAVLGATGGVGQMAVQLARLLGATAVVAVGRDPVALERVGELGATGSVSLIDTGEDELTAALLEAAGGGVDVVVDVLWGGPAMAAIAALAEEGRLVNVGNAAGTDVALPLQPMRQARSAVIGLSSGWAPLDAKIDAYSTVIDALVAGDVSVDHELVPLDSVADAWTRQASSPNTKLVVALR